jgi:hypothetical protein
VAFWLINVRGGLMDATFSYYVEDDEDEESNA